jgi:GPH family glycoside/pentoside/hexuronide:cation symporter
MTQGKKGLSLFEKLAYGCGDLGGALTGTLISVLFAVYLTDIVELPATWAAAIIFIGRTWDYVNDPIIGFLSNNTRTRWGSYRPWLLFGAIPFGVTFALLWWIPPLNSKDALFVYFAVVYFIQEGAFTAVNIPYNALTPRLTSDYDERTSLTSYRMVFSIVGSMLASVVPLLMIGEVIPKNINRVFMVGIVMAAIAMLPQFITFFGTKERVNVIEQKSRLGIVESLKAVGKNKPFLYAAMIYLFAITAFEVTSTMIIYYFKYIMQIADGVEIFLGVFFIVAVFAIPFWNHLTRRLDKTKVFNIAMALFIVVRIITMFFNASTPIALLYAIIALNGFAFAAGQTLPWAIVPDSIEYDELKTGKRHEGVFYSLLSTFRGIAVSLAIPAVLLLLDVSGYIANQQVQPAGADTMIRLLFGLSPLVLIGPAMLLAWKYPLNRARFEEIKKELEQRKAGHSTDGGI